MSSRYFITIDVVIDLDKKELKRILHEALTSKTENKVVNITKIW